MGLHRVCGADELALSGAKSVVVNGQRLALFLVDGIAYALRDRCPHQGALLSRGTLGSQAGRAAVTCLDHLWMFYLDTGAAVSNPAFCAETFPAKVENGGIYVMLP